jgi:hypothetical protein
VRWWARFEVKRCAKAARGSCAPNSGIEQMYGDLCGSFLRERSLHALLQISRA